MGVVCLGKASEDVGLAARVCALAALCLGPRRGGHMPGREREQHQLARAPGKWPFRCVYGSVGAGIITCPLHTSDGANRYKSIACVKKSWLLSLRLRRNLSQLLDGSWGSCC